MIESEAHDNSEHRDPVTLSEDGIARRESMLDELVDTMHGHHRARRRRRYALGSTLGLVLVASVLAIVWSNVTRPGPSAGTSAQDTTTTPQVAPETQHAAIVQTDATTLDRWTVQPRDHGSSTIIVNTRPRSSVTMINDEQLLEALAAVDPAAGVMQIGRQTILTGFPSSNESDAPREEPGPSETGVHVVPQEHTTT